MIKYYSNQKGTENYSKLNQYLQNNEYIHNRNKIKNYEINDLGKNNYSLLNLESKINYTLLPSILPEIPSTSGFYTPLIKLPEQTTST
jgi:hypothetical protein